jgi:hypothetical protein
MEKPDPLGSSRSSLRVGENWYAAPPGLFTRIIRAIVIPLKTSREVNLLCAKGLSMFFVLLVTHSYKASCGIVLFWVRVEPF